MLDTELTADDWQRIVAEFKDVVARRNRQALPAGCPQTQLWGAIGAVFGSWMNPRAVTYRRLHNIPAEWGTAVNVQAMVFGNMGEDCATGVAFTRNPSTGANEFLRRIPGQRAGRGCRRRHPHAAASDDRRQDRRANRTLPAMEEVMPEVFAELLQVRQTLEDHYRDMQDIEFTVERGKLWMLQTRTGKRTAQAALKIAVALVEEGLIEPRTRRSAASSRIRSTSCCTRCSIPPRR